MFYLETEGKYRIGKFSSVYRCHIDNTNKGRSSTNHMGKAVDLHIYEKDKKTRPSSLDERKKLCNHVRDLCVKHMNAQIRWKNKNRFSLEPATGSVSAPTWVHLDVRTFDKEYRADTLFVKKNSELVK